MDKWLFVEYMINVVDVFLIVYFVKVLIDKEEIYYYQILIIVFLQAFINTIINNIFGIASLIGLTFMLLILGIIFYFIFKVSLIKIYFFIILGLVINFLVEMLVANLLMFLPGIDPSLILSNSIDRMIGVVLSKTIFFLLIKLGISKIKTIKFLDEIKIYQLYLLFVPNIILIFLSFWFYKYMHSFGISFNLYITIITTAILVFSLSLFHITSKIIDLTKKEIEWKEKEEEYRIQNFYLNNIKELLEMLKAQQHDFNHHLGCIYGLMKLGNFDEMKSYINNLTKEVSDFNTIINVKNPIIAALLNVKLARAKGENIEIILSIDIPDELRIELIDLSSLMGNLLDNAIEACMKVDKDKRFIDVNMYMKNENLIIKIINSYVPVNTKNPIEGRYTTKEDKENHGYGLLNVQRIIEKYNGLIKIDENAEIFKVNIALPHRE